MKNKNNKNENSSTEKKNIKNEKNDKKNSAIKDNNGNFNLLYNDLKNESNKNK